MKKTSPSGGDIANMDSLKIPKGSNTSGSGGSKPSGGSVPITVRFNAGDECIDDIFQSFHNNSSSNSSAGGGGGGNSAGGGGGGGGDSLSSSPSQQQHQQNAEEVNTRNNFLQGNFFNRKRSGSIEGNSPTSVGPNLIAALSSSDTNSVGTWKLIKGKVTQTIEDIKSSKSSSNQTTATTITKGEPSEADSDPENSIINNPSVSDELTLDQELKLLQNKDIDSDSDAEFELIYEGEDSVERSRLRRGLANLKSKVKAKSAAYQLHQQTHPSLSASTLSISTTAAAVKPLKKDTSPSRSEGSGTSLRSSFLRKRRKQPIETGELASPSTPMAAHIPAPTAGSSAGATKKQKGIVPGKKVIEIESGVEMLEDMVPPVQGDTLVNASLPLNDKKQNNREEMKLPLKNKDTNEVNDNASPTNEELKNISMKSYAKALESNKINAKNVLKNVSRTYFARTVRRLPYVTLLGLLLIMIMPLPEFFRGVLACLVTMTLLEAMWSYLQEFIERILTNAEPERTEFHVPNFARMSFFEVPAVEEHKTVKSYSGWMNEVNSYDPEKFHISMAKSVYVKLEGTMLRISNTNARVPKRIMWNETPIDRKTIQFTDHRTYNLLDSRIEMLPLGLARKRYFNRKYPMQLIIKNCETKTDLSAVAADAVSVQTSAYKVSSKRPSAESLKEGSMDSIGKLADLKDSSKFFDARDSSSSSSCHLLLSSSSSGSKTQNSGELTEERSATEADSELDFASTIINSDLQSLLANPNSDADIKEMTSVPCGDETRLILFTRGDREKEDWYRRFLAAGSGKVNDQDLRLPNMRLIDENDMQAAAVKAALLLTGPMNKADYMSSSSHANQQTLTSNIVTDDSKTNILPTLSDNIIPLVVEAKADKATVSTTTIVSNHTMKTTPDKELGDDSDTELLTMPDETFEGLLMSSCAARNPVDYIRFMALYQNACNQSKIPVYKKPDDKVAIKNKKQRRNKILENELWKGIDQSLFLGPSGSVVWANVLAGRVLYSILNDKIMQGKIQDFLQKKLSSIKLPSFMEEVTITQIDLGNTPPLIHRISQPMLDERGTWMDADITYEGLLHITVTTRLNLLRLKRQSRNAATNMNLAADAPGIGTPTATNLPPINVISDDFSQNSTSIYSHDDHLIEDQSSSSAIYDSDAESSGHSSSESDSPLPGAPETAATNAEFNVFNTTPGNARRIFRIVDRFAASNFFQYATELSYVQRAMENMRSNITLRVELKGLVARGTLNIPPPPSDRIWLAFRGPPRLWISAKPAFGEKSVDWSIVTNVIENKLCEEVNKFLVYPNMVDVTIPILGQSTYSENE